MAISKGTTSSRPNGNVKSVKSGKQLTPAQRAEYKSLLQFATEHVGKDWQSTFDEGLVTFNEDNKSVLLAKLGKVVAYHTSFKDGHVRVHTSNGLRMLEDTMVPYYVDPTSKVVLENPHPKKREQDAKLRAQKEREARDAKMRRLSDTVLCLRQGDHWLAVEISPVESDPKGYYDVVLRRRVYLNIWSDLQELKTVYGVKNMYGKEARQLTSREAAQLNLN